MIDESDVTRLKEIFVTRQECHIQVGEIETEMSKDSVQRAVIETKLNQLMWIVTAVSGGIITMLVKMFFGD